MKIDYASNEERYLWEKRWEVVKPLREFLSITDRIPVKKFTVGRVRDIDDLRNALDYYKQCKCFKTYHIADDVAIFTKASGKNIEQWFNTVQRIYKNFSKRYQLRQQSHSSNKELTWSISTDQFKNKQNFVHITTARGQFRIGTVGSQHGKLVRLLGNDMRRIKDVYLFAAKDKSATTRPEQYSVLRRISKAAQHALSEQGYTLTVESEKEYLNCWLEINDNSLE